MGRFSNRERKEGDGMGIGWDKMGWDGGWNEQNAVGCKEKEMTKNLDRMVQSSLVD